MGVSKQDETILDSKRDFTYTGISLLSSVPLLFLWNNLEAVHSKSSLPVEMIVYIVGTEFVKITLCLGLFPASSKSFYSPKASSEFGFIPTLKLPTFIDTNLKGLDSTVKSYSSNKTLNMILEGLKGFFCFIISIALCHILVVLFGASFIENWILTLQFSTILATWLFFPFCLIIPPKDILINVFHLSAWGKLTGTLFRHKWRFIFTILGAWIGAVVVPLDWDEPWQKWPLPCLYSVRLTFILINLSYFIYLFTSLHGFDWKKLFSNNKSKTKSY